MINRVLIAITLLLVSSPVVADQWSAWEQGLRRACPARNVNLMGDGGYEEFIDAFYSTLSPRDQHRMDAVADTRRQCANEWGGFGCEMSRNLYAAQHLGLLQQMIRFGCRTVKCEEGALCSQFPSHPYKG
jgi:hypothetical protein